MNLKIILKISLKISSTSISRGETMFKHNTVLLKETVDGLDIKPDGIYVDATLGGGGHTEYLLSQVPDGRVIAFDQDIYAIDKAKEKFKDVENNLNKIPDLYMERLKTALKDYQKQLRSITKEFHLTWKGLGGKAQINILGSKNRELYFQFLDQIEKLSVDVVPFLPIPSKLNEILL